MEQDTKPDINPPVMCSDFIDIKEEPLVEHPQIEEIEVENPENEVEPKTKKLKLEVKDEVTVEEESFHEEELIRQIWHRIVSFHGFDPDSVMDGDLDIQVVDYASQLMKAQFSARFGLLPPSRLNTLVMEQQEHRDKIPKSEFAVQIHFIENHFLVSAQINGVLHIYDCVKTTVPHFSIVHKQLKVLYECVVIPNLHDLTPQTEGVANSSGFLAIANAIVLLTNRNPFECSYDMNQMRQHLRNCLLMGRIHSFPQVGEQIHELPHFEQSELLKDLLTSRKHFIEEENKITSTPSCLEPPQQELTKCGPLRRKLTKCGKQKILKENKRITKCGPLRRKLTKREKQKILKENKRKAMQRYRKEMKLQEMSGPCVLCTTSTVSALPSQHKNTALPKRKSAKGRGQKKRMLSELAKQRFEYARVRDRERKRLARSQETREEKELRLKLDRERKRRKRAELQMQMHGKKKTKKVNRKHESKVQKNVMNMEVQKINNTDIDIDIECW